MEDPVRCTEVDVLRAAHPKGHWRIGGSRGRGSPKKRLALIGKALAESMSVRELEQVAGAGRTARSIEQTVEAHLHQIVTTSDGLLGRATEWRASLLRLEDEPTTPELVELLQNAAQKQRSVAQACAANAGLLEARIDKATAELDGERAKETAKPANGKRAPATKKAQR